MTRVVFFSFGILEQGGGFEYYLMSTARDLSERFDDLEVAIVTMDPKTVEKLQHLLTVYFMRKQDPKEIYRETYDAVMAKIGPKVTYTRATSVQQLAKLLQTADVIYSKNEVLELVVLNRIGMKRLPPVILGVHTPIYYPHTPSISARLHNLVYTGLPYRRLIRPVRRLLVHNADDLRLVRSKLKFPRVSIVHQAFVVPPLPKQRSPEGPLRILFVGRLTEAKGVDVLITLLRTLRRRAPGMFTVKIAGSGDVAIEEQVKRLARDLPEVAYFGQVAHAAVPALYAWTDITLIPSKYETLNKVAIETAMAGKIAVCSDIPGPREVIEHEVTGFLLPPEPEAFVACVQQLMQQKMQDPAAFQGMGRAAYRRVQQKFDADTVYRAMYDDLKRTAAEA